MRLFWRGVGFGAALVATWLAYEGAASVGAIELAWQAPAACPTAEAFAASVRARTDGDTGTATRVRAEIRSIAEGFALAIEVDVAGQTTRRELAAGSCASLAEAGALVVAVARDPVAVVVAAPEVIAATATPTDTTTPTAFTPARTPAFEPDTRDDDRVTRSPARPRRGIAVRANGGVWAGAMKRAAPTIGFDLVAPARRSFRGELGALVIPRQRVDVTSDAGATLWLAVGAARGCHAPAIGRVRPSACLGTTLGAFGGRGVGSGLRAASATALWWSATAGFGVEVALGRRFGLAARIEGHVHLRRPGFHLEQLGAVHRVGETSALGWVGVQAVLP